MGPRRRPPVDNLYCMTFRVLSGVNLNGPTPSAAQFPPPRARVREGPTPTRTPTPSTRTHNLNLERRQVLGHDSLEGAAPRSPAQRHAPQRAM